MTGLLFRSMKPLQHFFINRSKPTNEQRMDSRNRNFTIRPPHFPKIQCIVKHTKCLVQYSPSACCTLMMSAENPLVFGSSLSSSSFLLPWRRSSTSFSRLSLILCNSHQLNQKSMYLSAAAAVDFFFSFFTFFLKTLCHSLQQCPQYLSA